MKVSVCAVEKEFYFIFFSFKKTMYYMHDFDFNILNLKKFNLINPL